MAIVISIVIVEYTIVQRNIVSFYNVEVYLALKDIYNHGI